MKPDVQQAIPASARTTVPHNRAARWFGHDLFLSFALGSPPRGTRDYASDLARRLRERDLVVFYSEESLPPGSPLSPTLTAALRASQALVLVLNAATLADPRWLRTELDAFRRHAPGRPIVAISLDGALSDSVLASPEAQWLGMQDQVWLEDAAGAVAGDAVVDGICKAMTHRKRNAVWRWVQGGLIAALSGLSIGLTFFAWQANQNAVAALRAAHEATAERVAGSASGVFAGSRLPQSFANGSKPAILMSLAAHQLHPGRTALDQLGAMLASHEHLDWLDSDEPLALTTAFTPDGQRLLQGSLKFGGIRLNGKTAQAQYWVRDLRSGRKLTPPISHDRSLHASAVHPNGRIGALGDDRGRVIFVDLDSGKALQPPLTTGLDDIRRIAFMPGDAGLWVADRHQLVHIKLDGQSPLAPVPLTLGDSKDGAGEEQFAVATCAEAARLIQALPDGHIEDRLLTSSNKALLLPGGAASKPVTSLSADCGGNRVVAYQDGRVHAWHRHARGWRSAWRWPGDSTSLPAGTAARVFLSADGRRAVLAINEKLLALNADDGQPVGDVLSLQTGISLISLAPDGHRAVLSTMDSGFSKGMDQRAIRLGHKTSEADVMCAGSLQHGGIITSLAVASAPSVIAYTAGADGYIKTCSLQGDQKALSVRASQHGLLRLQVDEDKRTLLALAADGSITIWSLPELTPLAKPPRGDWSRTVKIASFSSGGRYLSTQVEGNEGGAGFAVWEVATGRRTATLRDAPAPSWQEAHTFSLALSPDGRTLALGEAGAFGNDRSAITLWPLRGSHATQPLAGEPPLMEAPVTFSAQGRRVAMAGVYHPLVYEPGSNRTSFNLDSRDKFDEAVAALAFAPHDDNWIAQVAQHRVYYWRIDTGGSTYEELPASEGKLTAMAFTSDGQQMLLGTDQGRLLRVHPAWTWPNALCAKVLNVSLNKQEWTQLVSSRLPHQPQCPKDHTATAGRQQ